MIGIASSLVVVSIIQICGLIWWASNMTAGLAAQKEQIAEFKTAMAQLDSKISVYANVIQRVSNLEASGADREARVRDLEKRRP